MKKLLVFLHSVCLLLICVPIFVYAEQPTVNAVLFEETFDEYEADVDVGSTLMPDFFVSEANTIGDGYIKVMEDESGNLFLTSAVFSHVFTKEPVKGAYTFSLDVKDFHGSVSAGFFVRAPKTGAAYYEGDGDAGNSVSQSGLMIYTNDSRIGINIKTFDKALSSKIKNNTHWFDLPENVRFNNNEFHNLRIEDNGVDEIAVYIDSVLICRVTMEGKGAWYDALGISDRCFMSATLYDANGSQIGTYANPLMMYNGSMIGWATRVSLISVDNVKIVGEALAADTDKPDDTTAKIPETAPHTGSNESSNDNNTDMPDDTEIAPATQVIDDSLTIWILIAVMLVAVGITAGVVTVKVRK